MANTKVPPHMTEGLIKTNILPTETVGAGEWKTVTGSAANTAVSLPEGGTWAWFGFYLSAAGAMSGFTSGVDEGEAEVLPAVADKIGSFLGWRIA